jgi:predicted Zn-dependent protease
MVGDKKYILLVLIFSLHFFVGCTSVSTTADTDLSKTIYTDLNQEELPRSQYYQKLGENFYIHDEFSSAAEMFRLSLLHDAKNERSRFQLVKALVMNRQDHLAMIEMEHYLSAGPRFDGVVDKDMQLVSSMYERSKSYDKLIELQKNYFDHSESKWALWKIYEYQLFLDRFDQAIKTLDQLKTVAAKINLKSADDKDMELVSLIYERTKSYDKLIELQKNYFDHSKSKWALWKTYEYQLMLNRFDQAFITIDQLKEAGEDSFRLDLAQAEIYERQKKWSDVIAALNRAEEKMPLDEFILRKKVLSYFESKDWPLLNQECERYSKYHPYNLDVSEKWAYSAIQTKDYDVALAEFKKQKEKLTDSLSVEFKIAHVLFLMKDFASAEEAYASLYERTKSDQSVFYLAQIYIINNRYADAADQVLHLASTSEYYPFLQIQLSRLEWKNNEKDLSLNRMRTAHILRPESLDLYLEYAQYLIWAKNYVEAIALLEKANTQYPQNEKIKLLSAYNHFQLNNEELFQKNIRAAIALAPNNAEIYDVLAELWYEKQKPVEEIKYLAQKAIALDSKSKNVRPLLAWTLLQQDQLAESVALFEDFYDKNPNEIFYAESLAEVYSRSSLSGKTNSYQIKAAELKLSNQLKNEIEFFSYQNQMQKTDVQNSKSRLPASLEQ